MPIAVFDVDATLTDTMDVDIECYERAIQEELGVEMPEHWATLEEIADSAILAAACELQGIRFQRGRPSAVSHRALPRSR